VRDTWTCWPNMISLYNTDLVPPTVTPIYLVDDRVNVTPMCRVNSSGKTKAGLDHKVNSDAMFKEQIMG